jgi:5-methylcytosine-specific restriction protein A
LRDVPLCAACGARGRLVAAKVVDHVQPIKSGGARFDRTNLQPLCIPCHNRKTARESARVRKTP